MKSYQKIDLIRNGVKFIVKYISAPVPVFTYVLKKKLYRCLLNVLVYPLLQPDIWQSVTHTYKHIWISGLPV